MKRTAIKVVRAAMEEILYFLSKNKQLAHNVKILHLLRDPRGRLNSKLNSEKQLKKQETSLHWLSQRSVKVCQRIMKDVMIRKELEKQFPNMFMEIHYEDIAANPIKMANHIYQFVYSEDAPDTVKQWLKLNTNDPSSKEILWGTNKTTRKNSTATSTAWKNELSKEEADIIEKKCKDLLQHINAM